MVPKNMVAEADAAQPQTEGGFHFRPDAVFGLRSSLSFISLGLQTP